MPTHCGPFSFTAMPLHKPLTRIVILHWLALPLLLASLASGLRIHISSRLDDLLPGIAQWLPQGDIYGLHLLLACGWLALACAYGTHLWLNRAARPYSAAGRMAPYNRGLIQALRWLLLALLLLGLAIYLAGSAAAGGWLLWAHRWLAFTLLACFILHMVMQAGWTPWNQLRAIVLPRLTWQACIVTLLAALGISTATWLLRPFWQQATTTVLPVSSIALSETITVDGASTEAAWQQAAARTVDTLGVGREQAAIPVTVQALRQGEVMYFRFSWPDPTPSLQHLPLIKTPTGWQIKQRGLNQHDETLYYEDKLAIMFAKDAAAAGSGSIQLGQQPVHQAPPHATGRGYHAAQSGGLIDVWHWKAVRTHGFNQLDDSHFGSPYPVVPGDTRYTAGYKSDPLQAGGYTENWAWPGEGNIRPKRLPRDPALLDRFQQAKANDPSVYWGMSWYESMPYDSKDDHYPVGTVMPSVLWKTVFEGDRGDVQAAAQWQQGRWTLEAARGIQSASPFDLDLVDRLYLWVAVFDHAQIRHSYHLRPLRLRFD